MKKLLCKMLCVLMLATFAIPADASAANLLASEPLTVEELEAGLLYDLKPLAAVYLDAGAIYGVDPVFLAAKDAEESGWGRYTAAPNNLGGWTSDDGGYMSFDSPEDYIYYSAEKMRELYLEEDGRYYNGTSLSDVCVAYNGNPEWAEHIESIMDDIYWRIEKSE